MFFNILFHFPLTISRYLATTLDILCHLKNFKFLRIFGHLKNFKFLRIFGILHVVSEHKIQTLGLNVAQLAYVEQ